MTIRLQYSLFLKSDMKKNPTSVHSTKAGILKGKLNQPKTTSQPASF